MSVATRSPRPAAPPATSRPSVRIVVDYGCADRAVACSASAGSSGGGFGATAWTVTVLAFLSGGLAAFDLYLLLSGLA
jgi:hypothetical protein